MKTYLIHQQTNPQDSRNSKFEMVGIVEALDFNKVFHKTQNWDTPWNEEEPCRSTMVGDIFEELTSTGSICYRVDSIGLSVVDNPNKELIGLLNSPEFWKDLNLTEVELNRKSSTTTA